MGESGEKKLIQDCIGYLNEMLDSDSGGNRALYPVITVFFGKESAEHFPTVRDTLDINWRQDTAYLKYINIIKNEQGFTCRDLVTEEASKENPLAFIERAVVKMLGEELAFPDKSRTRFEYILLGEDEDAKEYYDFMIDMKLGSHYNVFKTMFIMMDEREADKRSRIRELLKHIGDNRENTKNKLGTIYLLSNYLRNGQVLLDYNLYRNYRLVADLILLGGNLGPSKTLPTIENYDTIKTAAYALAEKPIRGITVYSLQRIMRFLMEENERSYTESSGDHMQTAEKILNKLDIQRGKIKCLEEIFQTNITKIFPPFEEIQYLAFLSEQDHKNIYKEKRASSGRMDRATGENWTLFFEENYRDKLEGLLSDDRFMTDCLEKIEKSWRKALSYGDALYGLEDGRVNHTLEDLTVASSVSSSNSVEESLHLWAIEEMRKQFYSHMIQLLSRILSQIHQDAKRFVETYTGLEEKIKKEPVDDKERRIQDYYIHLVENFLRMDNGQISSDIFQLKNDEEAIIRALTSGFEKLVKNRQNDSMYKIYGMSFEDELKTRLNTLSADDRILQIKDILEEDEKIENKVRLHGRDKTYEARPRGTYYLMKENMGFAKAIGGDMSSIFQLNRTDCIEKIAIYDVDDHNQGKYCNLLEMVGEV